MRILIQVLVGPARLILIAVRPNFVNFTFDMMMRSQQITAAARHLQFNDVAPAVQKRRNVCVIRLPQEAAHLQSVDEQLGYYCVRRGLKKPLRIRSLRCIKCQRLPYTEAAGEERKTLPGQIPRLYLPGRFHQLKRPFSKYSSPLPVREPRTGMDPKIAEQIDALQLLINRQLVAFCFKRLGPRQPVRDFLRAVEFHSQDKRVPARSRQAANVDGSERDIPPPAAAGRLYPGPVQLNLQLLRPFEHKIQLTLPRGIEADCKCKFQFRRHRPAVSQQLFLDKYHRLRLRPFAAIYTKASVVQRQAVEIGMHNFPICGKLYKRTLLLIRCCFPSLLFH
ncbi:hypothetical protein D3C75_571590 [compost metagenome]